MTSSCTKIKIDAAMKQDARNRAWAFLGPGLTRHPYIHDAVIMPDGRIVQYDGEFPMASQSGGWYFRAMDRRVVPTPLTPSGYRNLIPPIDQFLLIAYPQWDRVPDDAGIDKVVADSKYMPIAGWNPTDEELHKNWYLVLGDPTKKFSNAPNRHLIMVWKDTSALTPINKKRAPTFENIKQFRVI